ncbi:proteophosphoglycan ppg4 [Rhodotorula toruloides]|uniref:Proteophosphoglycan ppg4 n=1 Tax=Rhodotorula toruloides TaxID=5286 RepID=A0A511KDH7_RHOTO|nr:proteophosphoglycan ppg4 [Rhodotorula toruloides]
MYSSLLAATVASFSLSTQREELNMSTTPASSSSAASTTSGAAINTTQREDTGAGSAIGGGETAPLHSTHSRTSHTGTPAPANPTSSAASGAAVDTSQRQDTGAGAGNVASGAETSAAGEGAEGPAATEPEGGYPEQVHAGKLGYGPHYAGNPGISDQLKGTEEIIKGKLAHKPELVQQGHDRKDGVLAERKREYEAEHEDDAFSKPAEGQGNPGGAKGANAPSGEAAGAKSVRESGDVAADKAATAPVKSN